MLKSSAMWSCGLVVLWSPFSFSVFQRFSICLLIFPLQERADGAGDGADEVAAGAGAVAGFEHLETNGAFVMKMGLKRRDGYQRSRGAKQSLGKEVGRNPGCGAVKAAFSHAIVL